MSTSLDGLMFAVIVGGVGLCILYFRDAYRAWRKHRATALRNEMRMRKLHTDRLVGQDGGPIHNVDHERTADPAPSWTDGAMESDASR